MRIAGKDAENQGFPLESYAKQILARKNVQRKSSESIECARRVQHLLSVVLEQHAIADEAAATAARAEVDSEATRADEEKRSQPKEFDIKHLREKLEKPSTGTMSQTAYASAEGPLEPYGSHVLLTPVF